MNGGWRASYSQRFLARAIQRPARQLPWVPLTDAQIELLPESVRPLARMSRELNLTMSRVAQQVAHNLAVARHRPVIDESWPSPGHCSECWDIDRSDYVPYPCPVVRGTMSRPNEGTTGASARDE